MLLVCCQQSVPSAVSDATRSLAAQSCRDALTCRLLDAPDCTPSPGAEAALACQQDRCATSDYACFGLQCAEVSACYFAGGPGSLSCAQVWQCFGDCGDEAPCLDRCAAGAELEARSLFLAVEACSDAEVSRRCDEVTDVCDRQVLSGPCAPHFSACLADRDPLPESLAGGCACAADADACVTAAGDAIAACPSADADRLRERLTCLRDTCGSCPSFSPSPLCREVLGAREVALP